MVNAELLTEIFERVAKERMAKEIREWVVYTAPPDIARIYQEYMERMEKENNEP
jgi:hypothetical protein